MTKKSFFLVTALLSQLGLLMGPGALAAEKMRFGTSVKGNPFYELPAIAAEEQGLWKQNGLEVTWCRPIRCRRPESFTLMTLWVEPYGGE